LRPSRQHLALHSFPTRRSSDLSGQLPFCLAGHIASLAASLLSGRRERAKPLAWRQRCGPITEQSSLWPATPTLRLPTRLPPISRDRKSTRLNSSHEWISYAVFC